MHNLWNRFSDIFYSDPAAHFGDFTIGHSRGGLPIDGYIFGTGTTAVSLIGGCHADEPVGPHFLRRLVTYLSLLDEQDPILNRLQWWIVPHINPDGEQNNATWFDDKTLSYSLIDYLRHVYRELPGDDLEFGFPRSKADSQCRPESRAVYNWWQKSPAPFKLHASLHGMAFGHGPWFLLEQTWIFRTTELRAKCTSAVRQMGYSLHDEDRQGEKGFFRIEEGFCTRPDSRYMIQHFKEKGDETTASKFRPSSMEAIRSIYPDALTLVTEMPLFLVPKEPQIGPDGSGYWKDKSKEWRKRLLAGEPEAYVIQEATQAGIKQMPVKDQMKLQWRYITAGIETVLNRK